MKDPIERQDVLDAIYKCTDIYINNLPIMIDKVEAYKAISELSPAEPEIIRCNDCKYRYLDVSVWKCPYGNFYCACGGERRTDGNT